MGFGAGWRVQTPRTVNATRGAVRQSTCTCRTPNRGCYRTKHGGSRRRSTSAPGARLSQARERERVPELRAELGGATTSALGGVRLLPTRAGERGLVHNIPKLDGQPRRPPSTGHQQQQPPASRSQRGDKEHAEVRQQRRRTSGPLVCTSRQFVHTMLQNPDHHAQPLSSGSARACTGPPPSHRCTQPARPTAP